MLRPTHSIGHPQVGKDSKECMQECVSEFISFIASEYPYRTVFGLIIVLNQVLQSKRSVYTREEKDDHWR